MEEKLSNSPRLFSICIPNGGKPLPLYPIVEENLLRCRMQRRKPPVLVFHNTRKDAVLDPTRAKNKILWYYPFKHTTPNTFQFFFLLELE
jgi:hypothetical protein